MQDGRIGESNGVVYHAEQVVRTNGIVAMTLRYEAFGPAWTQHFTTVSLSEIDVAELLRQHGFGHIEWLGRDTLWLAASSS